MTENRLGLVPKNTNPGPLNIVPFFFDVLLLELNMSVVVYSKPNCPQCDQTIKRLESKGVEYEKHDVTADQAAYDKAISLGYRTMPVVVVGETHWSGFRPDKINALA